MTDEKNISLGPEVTAPLEHRKGLQLKLAIARTFFLGGIFSFCMLAALYYASNVLLPVFFALLLTLVLQPAVRILHRWSIPPVVSSVVLIAMLFGALFGLGTAIWPALGKWTLRIQQSMPQLQEQLSGLHNHLTGVQKALVNAEKMVPGADTKTVVVAMQGTTLSDRMLAGTGHLASGLVQTVITLLFLLISGDTFLRRLVEILPRFQDKKHAVGIFQQVEDDMSAYLVTITLANAGVGAATGIALHMLRFEDPLLWGVLAFTLNYVPIVGPIAMTAIVFLVGSIGGNPLGGETPGIIPTCVFFAIHLIESQAVTPYLLSRRFTLNPVLIILSLTFWFWMWGIIGAILATPMLAVTKIICDRIPPLKPIGHLIEGNTRTEHA